MQYLKSNKFCARKSNRIFVCKVGLKIEIPQCLCSGYAPFIRPLCQFLDTPARTFGLPSRDSPRRVIHVLQIRVSKTDQRLS